MRDGKWSAARIARIGVLAALSAILYAIPGIPVIPPIYKLDFSTMPALLAGFAMGPISGLIVLLIKDLTGLMHSSSMGVGEIADFLMSGAFVVTASLLYARRRDIKGAVFGMAAGTVVMGAMGVIANYAVLIPFYVNVMSMPIEKIVGMIAKTIPAVDSMGKLLLIAVLPFNLLKGAILSVVAGILFKYIKPLLGVKKAEA